MTKTFDINRGNGCDKLTVKMSGETYYTDSTQLRSILGLGLSICGISPIIKIPSVTRFFLVVVSSRYRSVFVKPATAVSLTLSFSLTVHCLLLCMTRSERTLFPKFRFVVPRCRSSISLFGLAHTSDAGRRELKA